MINLSINLEKEETERETKIGKGKREERYKSIILWLHQKWPYTITIESVNEIYKFWAKHTKTDTPKSETQNSLFLLNNLNL